jgi:hypothetical protein
MSEPRGTPVSDPPATRCRSFLERGEKRGYAELPVPRFLSRRQAIGLAMLFTSTVLPYFATIAS